ncbi:copper amine oxidase N-terminal domain-containing protein [Paenibacillus silvae]|nr:copper amine oxidase N-terminal domain-containing protein [Paenibacillus silvae]
MEVEEHWLKHSFLKYMDEVKNMWKKKVSIAFLSVMMLFGTAVSASAAQQNVSVKVDSKRVPFPDAQPYFENSRVMIPVRFVSESLGAKVSYGKESSGNKVNRVVTIKLGDKVIYMTVNSSKVLVGEQIITLDVPARLQEERVYVPLRFVSEALGTQVKWNQAQKLVSISTGSGVTEPEKETKTPSTGMYKAGFEWPREQELGKTLFVNNVQVKNGKLTLTLPKNAEGGSKYTDDGSSVKLIPGKTYTFDIGKGAGFLSISKPESKGDQWEGYYIFLDANYVDDIKALFGTVKEGVVVAGVGQGVSPLSEVINDAKKLK